MVGVAFHSLIDVLYHFLWDGFQKMDGWMFCVRSFPILFFAGLISGCLMYFGSKSAAGSGIPQLKLAYWKDRGVLELPPVLVKFVAGAVTVGGGMSLGREGPSVYMAGGLTSWMARKFGAILHEQRVATLCGAAAGLAAAFNTPIAAVTFVLEELIEDLNSRAIGSILLASVVSIFGLYVIVGDSPVFIIPTVTQFHWKVYLATVPAAVFAAWTGVVFQKRTLEWRKEIKTRSRIPVWFRPAVGAIFTWILASIVFASTRRMGVLGLGYDDLAATLAGELAAATVLILLLSKLLATISCYAWGGCGGIFAPTLFMGAMVGSLTALITQGLCGFHSDEVRVLAVVGMTACLGAVVRAPITSILIVFEMTHNFAMVPPLMLGTLVSQAISRMGAHENFYTQALNDDGDVLDRHRGARDFSSWRSRKISDYASLHPRVLATESAQEIRLLLKETPYMAYPAVDSEGVLRGVVSREI
jgi:CIC family chloride channel protein